jgi:uncharacterized membrane protein YgcG
MTRDIRRATPFAIAILLAVGVALSLVVFAEPARATAAAATCNGPVAGQHIYDCAGILSASDIATLEAHAKTVEQAGAAVVVYLQVKDATYDETYDDAGNLMERWNVESQPGAHDGLVVFLNLIPGNEHHGEVALFAGEKHFQHGNLPESELQRIYQDVMLPYLKDEDLVGGIAAGLDAAAHSLRYGPPVDPTQQAAANIGRVPYNLLAGLLALASLGLFLLFWPRKGAAVEDSAPRTVAPGSLTPAEAGALVTGQVSDRLIEATLLDFAHRGLLALEPAAGNLVLVRLLQERPQLRDFEQELWQCLEETADDERVIMPSKLSSLRARWQSVRGTLRAEMMARGWFDPEARGRRVWLFVAAGLAFVGAIVGFLLTAIGQEGWPLFGFALLILCGIGLLLAGLRYPETSEAGRHIAAPWRGYRDGLKVAAIIQQPTVDVSAAIPYVFAMSTSSAAHRFMRHAAPPEQEALQGALVEGAHPASQWRYAAPYWIYYDGFHSGLYSASSGGGSGGSFGGAAGGGGGAGGSF